MKSRFSTQSRPALAFILKLIYCSKAPAGIGFAAVGKLMGILTEQS